MLKFTDDHEWIKLDGDVATVGITEYATEQLGDLVFVELPDVGTQVSKGDTAATIESVKAASEICAPLDGEVVEVNEAIAENPESVNEDPRGAGWFFKLRLADVSVMNALLDEDAYKKITG